MSAQPIVAATDGSATTVAHSVLRAFRERAGFRAARVACGCAGTMTHRVVCCIGTVDGTNGTCPR
jgi:hypothetical protein